MKLKQGMLLQDVGGEHMAVASGEAAKSFNGLIRNNATADLIFRQLMTDTTEDAIVSAMLAEYDAPEDVIRRDVQAVIVQLKEAGLLDD